MQTLALIGAISIAAQAHFNLSATLATVSAIAEQHLTVSAAQWWANNGHIGQVPQEIVALRELAMEVGGGVACEVGFNAGHSAAVILEGSGIRLLHEFDIMVQPYSNASCDHFERRYTHRFRMHRGNSRHTLREFARKVSSGEEAGCDLWFLDGAHSRLFARDFPNALAAAAPGAVLMVDDVSSRFPKVQHVWHGAVDKRHGAVGKRQLAQRRCSTVDLPPPAGLKGWCVGTKPAKANGVEDRKPRRKSEKTPPAAAVAAAGRRLQATARRGGRRSAAASVEAPV